jgi:hypothetical protein
MLERWIMQVRMIFTDFATDDHKVLICPKTGRRSTVYGLKRVVEKEEQVNPTIREMFSTIKEQYKDKDMFQDLDTNREKYGLRVEIVEN